MSEQMKFDLGMPLFRCEICSKPLPTQKRQTKYCTRACYMVSKQRMREASTIPCGLCGKAFSRCPSRQRGGFCSMRCFGLSKVVPEKWTCPTCGGQKQWGAKECRACWAKSKLQPLPNISCRNCGAALHRTAGQWACAPRKHGAFCNAKCFHAYNRGPRNNAYIDGGSPAFYPNEFIRRRRLILERDGHRCFVCWADGKMDVHHIDRDKHNNADHNLVTLCRQCHSEQRGTPKEVLEKAERLSYRLAEAHGYPIAFSTLRSRETTTISLTAS